MASELPSQPSKSKVPAFAVTCWLLALVAFSQLLVAGLALSTRFEESRKTKIVVKEVPKLVVVRIPAAPEIAALPSEDAHPSLSPGAAVTAAAPPVLESPALDPTPLKLPDVADPRSELLVKEARKARVAGDMVLAIVKLEEALTDSPDDPTIHYELGLVHEQMGVFDVAADHYNKVYQMRLEKAGSLYTLAAAKLRDGFGEEDFHGKLSLGRVRPFRDPDTSNGERVVLTIPIQKAPGEEIDYNDISVTVRFFNRNSKGEISERESDTYTKDEWVTLPFDWSGDEELLRMTYLIPPQDPSTSHLFGDRKYYGQVVTLAYKGKILDVDPYPRELATRIPRSGDTAPSDPGQPEFQENDPNLGVLPSLLSH